MAAWEAFGRCAKITVWKESAVGRSQQERATQELAEAVREFTEAVRTLRRQNEETQERLLRLYWQRPALEAESLRRWLSEAAETREEISKGVVVIPVPVSYESGGGLDEESSIELALKATREMREEVERPPGEPAPGPEEIRRRREERREAESEDRA